jgi:hypothetical protein
MIDVAKLTISSPQPTTLKLVGPEQPAELKKLGRQDSPELREAFHDFVGQSFFGQVLSEMRKSVDKPAYFHGGMGEEMFQQQLDQVLVEKLSDASSKSFSEPMYELFMLGRGS